MSTGESAAARQRARQARRASKGTKARRMVGWLVAALFAYFIFIGYRGFYLLGQTSWALKLLGVAVIVLPLVGLWVVLAELRFGVATQRLAERLNEENAAYAANHPDLVDTDADDVADLELEALPRLPSGRVDRAAADEYFVKRRAEVEAYPDEWQRWYRLSEAYDFAGDRRRAREAMRHAIGIVGY